MERPEPGQVKVGGVFRWDPVAGDVQPAVPRQRSLLPGEQVEVVTRVGFLAPDDSVRVRAVRDGWNRGHYVVKVVSLAFDIAGGKLF